MGLVIFHIHPYSLGRNLLIAYDEHTRWYISLQGSQGGIAQPGRATDQKNAEATREHLTTHSLKPKPN
jgi:hypothetical protein